MTVDQEIELKHKSIKVGDPWGIRGGAADREWACHAHVRLHRHSQTLWEIARREVEVRDQAAKLAHLEEAFGKIQVRETHTTASPH